MHAELRKQLSLDIRLDAIATVQREDRNPSPVPSLTKNREYEFRLFSYDDLHRKVALHGDYEILDAEAKLVAQRPRKYYIADPPDHEETTRLLSVARSGEDVFKFSQRPNWGMQMAWRVINVTTQESAIVSEFSQPTAQNSMNGITRPRTRPSKKSRIAFHRRKRAQEEKKQLTKKLMAEKEEHLKEKKKRMNRLKKLRKRAKKKEARGDGETKEQGGNSSDNYSESDA